MNLEYSFIIPIYNRPDEIKELLDSFSNLRFSRDYEIVIVEDGSSIPCHKVVQEYTDTLNISYYSKSNSGPGPSRNFGMRKAKGNYFLILDSDCLLPPQYLEVVHNELRTSYVDFFGGPDAAMESFSDIQKAINYTMTSVLTTGGIRGGRNANDTFQPRSFNMGISKNAFEKSEGFGKIHPGEDPDLVLRLWKMGFQSRLISDAFVYHKRRISWSKFHTQVYKFGMVRPILNTWHKGTSKVTYWFPTLFALGALGSVALMVLGIVLPLLLCGLYITIVFMHAIILTRSVKVAMLSIVALFIQFFGYGYGFLKSTFFVSWLKRNPKKEFPELFFD